jgi:hypothetical protein
MARPKKENADYFSHDKDMRNDYKIKAIRRKYKNEGYAIWNMLLEHLTDCDYFEYEYTDLNIELLSGDFDIEPSLLKEMIEYFILLKLLILKDGVIKSQQLIKRFDSLLKKRNRNTNLTTNGLQTAETLKNEVSVTETTKNGVMDVQNTQSKVKYSKVKYSKEEEEEEKENESYIFNNKLIDIDNLPLEYLLNKRVVNAVVENRKNKFKNIRHMEVMLFEFAKTLKQNGVLSKTMADFSSHFRYWHLKQQEKVGEVNQSITNIPIG